MNSSKDGNKRPRVAPAVIRELAAEAPNLLRAQSDRSAMSIIYN